MRFYFADTRRAIPVKEVLFQFRCRNVHRGLRRSSQMTFRIGLRYVLDPELSRLHPLSRDHRHYPVPASSKPLEQSHGPSSAKDPFTAVASRAISKDEAERPLQTVSAKQQAIYPPNNR